MKRYVLILAALLGGSHCMKAQSVSVENSRMSKDGSRMIVEMELDLSALQVSPNRAVLLTPRIKSEADSLLLDPVGVYGRSRYYHYVRNGKNLLGGSRETVIRASQIPDRFSYKAEVPYADWMNGSSLILGEQTYGCCSDILAEHDAQAGGYKEVVYKPVFTYIHPQAEAGKSRALQGSAFIDFPVNKTVIRPEYRNNRAELDRIIATIDSVRNDKDIRITSLFIKGYASPEGSYAANERLAKGRTEALRQYVAGMYDFPQSFISTSYEPEDWEGLKAYVEQSALPHKQEILSLIAGSDAPDRKEQKIKTAYPEDYRHLLEHCYPALRHSDYRVEYVIRTFSDVEEIRQLIRTQPQKLNLQEFYLAAQGLEPGSDAFNEVFETAVRMFPDDEAANLNAANASMEKGDLKSADSYLSKAGASSETMYARGVLAALKKNYAEAARYFEEARLGGITQADDALKQLEELEKYR